MPLPTEVLQSTPISDCMERLRDHKVMTTLRIYLAYLHDQPACVCYEGMTSTSAKLLLAMEGFPVRSVAELREWYIKLHEHNGIDRKAALADLEAHRVYISSERIQRLQRARECTNKFYGRYPSK